MKKGKRRIYPIDDSDILIPPPLPKHIKERMEKNKRRQNKKGGKT